MGGGGSKQEAPAGELGREAQSVMDESNEPLLMATTEAERAAHEDVESRPGTEAPKESGNHSSAASISTTITTLIMLGDMLGLGSLTLPADFARLGWAVALGLILLCALGTLYSGRLYTLLTCAVPSAKVFDDFGRSAYGKTGAYLVFGTVYLTILFEPVIFHLTSVQALQQVFGSLGSWVASLIVAAIMLPLGQVQGLEDVGLLSLVGIAGMVLAIGVTAGKLFYVEAENYIPPVAFNRKRDYNKSLVSLFDIVFCFGGQVNWPRYFITMKHRTKFPIAVAVTTAIMTGIYVAIGGIGYWKLGQDFDHTKPITSVLPQDGWTVSANVGLFAHCILAYQINLNVWTHLLLHLLAPRFNRPEVASQWSGKSAWALVSCTGVVVSLLAAVAFPFFSTVMAIIAALGDLAGAYTLPALFCLAVVGHRMGRGERLLCYVLIPTTFLLSLLGIFSSIHTLVKEATQ